MHLKISTLMLFISFLLVSTTKSQLKENSKINKTNPTKKSLLDGKKLYSEICLGCHQEDGAGVPGMNPPLIQTTYVLGDKSQLIQVILKGLNGKIKIQGKIYSNIMASQAYLKDDQIASILTYVRTSFGNKASSISAEEVKLARTKL